MNESTIVADGVEKALQNVRQGIQEGLDHANGEIQATLGRLIELPIASYQELAGILVKQVVIRDSLAMALTLVE